MTARILVGDCVRELQLLPARSVQTCITSPPYWGLRDYGVEGQLGLEEDPADYVAKLVAVFRQVRRVLRNDGTLWLNMGDSYTDGGRGDDTGSTLMGSRQCQSESRRAKVREGKPFGLGRKQLVGMPWRIAFALQADGWLLRSDVIWHKPNPMPESVTDRPTKAHEYLFLFAQSERYFYDAKAIEEPQSNHERARRLREQREGLDRTYALRRDQPHGQHPPGANGVAKSAAARQALAVKGTRNKRSVWSISTRAFKGAHFATFPPQLVEPCILAGSAARACEMCGAPWRVVYSEPAPADGRGPGNKARKRRNEYGGVGGPFKRQAHAIPWHPTTREPIGAQRTCRCSLASGTARSLVLDPFGGAGTTALVAEALGRDSVLIELNEHYASMARERLGLEQEVAS
jgi:DNA modification methylase